MTVRPATVADVGAVARLELEGFPDDAWTADYLRLAAEGSLPTVRLLVAETVAETRGSTGDGAGDGTDAPGGEIVGHAIVSTVFEVAELQRIAVGSAHRRQGCARALLASVVASAVEAGAERLLLEVRETNEPALAFYASAGFVEIDRRPRYYRDGTAGVVLQLLLGQGR